MMRIKIDTRTADLPGAVIGLRDLLGALGRLIKKLSVLYAYCARLMADRILSWWSNKMNNELKVMIGGEAEYQRIHAGVASVSR